MNASGLGEHSRLRAGLLTEGFRPIAGFSGADAAIIGEDGFRIPVKWKAGAALPQDIVRIDIAFVGVRPEDAALHAVYVAGISS